MHTEYTTQWALHIENVILRPEEGVVRTIVSDPQYCSERLCHILRAHPSAKNSLLSCLWTSVDESKSPIFWCGSCTQTQGNDASAHMGSVFLPVSENPHLSNNIQHAYHNRRQCAKNVCGIHERHVHRMCIEWVYTCGGGGYHTDRRRFLLCLCCPAPSQRGAFSHSAGTAPILTLFIPGTPPENHPPTEGCMIHSKQHRGFRIQDPGTRGKHQTKKNPGCTSRGCRVQNSGPWDPWLPVVENSRLFAQRAQRTVRPQGDASHEANAPIPPNFTCGPHVSKVSGIADSLIHTQLHDWLLMSFRTGTPGLSGMNPSANAAVNLFPGARPMGAQAACMGRLVQAHAHSRGQRHTVKKLQANEV